MAEEDQVGGSIATGWRFASDTAGHDRRRGHGIRVLKEPVRRPLLNGRRTDVDARLAARRALGGVARAKELHRDARSFRWLDDLRQDAHTSDQIESLVEVIEYASHCYPLMPGDIVTTGSPAGVGRIYEGDRVRLEVEGVGSFTDRKSVV